MIAWLKPTAKERRFLGRFYLSDFVAEATNILQPFAFVYLLFAFERADWALIPLLVEKAVVFAFEIPTGAFADRFGRKRSVILGDWLSGLAWIAVPLAMLAPGSLQLVLVCACFAMEALGQCLASGAEEAWVVDNLEANGQRGLVDRYLARTRSISSIGGVIAGTIAFTFLLVSPISASLLSVLWIVGGLGQIAAAFLLAFVPEHPYRESGVHDVDGQNMLRKDAHAFRSITRSRPLLALSIVIAISAFAHAIISDAFDMSLVLRDFDPRGLAPIGIGVDLLGIAAPLFGIALAKRFGRRKSLLLLSVLPGLLALFLFTSPGIAGVIGLLFALRIVDDMWDPIEEAYLQALAPSNLRATVGSIANQIGSVASLAGFGLFAWMLGAHAEELNAAIPDLVTAFGGAPRTEAPVPEGAFGLPLPDAALLLFAVLGALVVPVLMVKPWFQRTQGFTLPASAQKQTFVSTEDTPNRRELLRIKDELDTRLHQYNPGENLSWWVAADAFEIPAHTVEKLRRVGAALPKFFAVANELFYRHHWVRTRLQKKFSPHYARLNQAQKQALPLLIRPDIVCNEDWEPKFVELEITVGCRADTATMVEQYGLTRDRNLVRTYANMIRRRGWGNQTLALLTAPHPFFLDLPDDARAFGTMLRREGLDVVVLTGDDLPRLRFDGEDLVLCGTHGDPDRIIHVVDRFIDIYEIAELQHPGSGAILDAYLAGKIIDINTAKQFLDEKDWMALFWDPRLESEWREGLGAEAFDLLQSAIPRTRIVREDTVVDSADGQRVLIRELAKLPPEQRRYVIKESGTSTTASGAQAFHVLHQMTCNEATDLIEGLLASGVEHIIQEIVESAKVSFTALDPEDDRVVTQHGARTKLSVFYVDGDMTDMRFVASNVHYAVNDEDCVVGVVRW